MDEAPVEEGNKKKPMQGRCRNIDSMTILAVFMFIFPDERVKSGEELH